MKVRQATQDDIPALVSIDQAAYGTHGADKAYFKSKFKSFPQGILVVEEDGKVTGFTVIELLDKNELPQDFGEFKPTEPLTGKWIHIIAFTTATNYKDAATDSLLLQAAEKVGIELGCASSCVPLTKQHPFERNNVFGFWKSNGYKTAGEINWHANNGEKFACWFYRKKLI